MDQEVVEFWARQGSAPFCSTEEVILPGSQEELLEGTCSKCDGPATFKEKREKGVDTAITSFLWETSERWHSVGIVSGDADFVPPARSLKHRGKTVFCLVEPGSARRDLVQVCTSHLELDVRFLQQDLRSLEVLRKGGNLDQEHQEVVRRFGACEVTCFLGHSHPGRTLFYTSMLVKSISRDDANAALAGMQQRLAQVDWGAWLQSVEKPGSTVVDATFSVHPGKHAQSQDQQVVEGINRHVESVGDADWYKACATPP
jgi:hypothetical protein